jgi:mevalonate kinase
MEAGAGEGSLNTYTTSQELLGATNRAIVSEARVALERGDAERLGALMTAAQVVSEMARTGAH